MRNLKLFAAIGAVAVSLAACAHYDTRGQARYGVYGFSEEDHIRWHDQADRYDAQSDRYEDQAERYEEMACRYDEFFLGGYSCYPRHYGMSWGGPYRHNRGKPYGGVYRNFP